MSYKWLSLLLFGFFLQACGGGGGSSSPPPPVGNSAPIAGNQSLATNPDNAMSGVLAATDSDGDALTFTIATQPVSGTVILSGGGNQNFVYTPNPGFSGADSFSFTASDGEDTSPTAVVTINVNSQPVAAGVNFSTSEIVAFSGSVSATDVEGDAVTFAVSTQPSKGSVTITDTAIGTFTYTPNVNQDGLDSFSITASDAFQSSAEAMVNVEIFNWAGTQQFGTTLDDFAATGGLNLTADDGLIFGGGTEGQIAGSPLVGVRDAWLRKVDRRGNEVWTVQFGDTTQNSSRIVVPDPQGNGTLVIVSRFLSGGNARGAYVHKFDNNGIEQFGVFVDFQGVNPLAGAYWGDVDANGDLQLLSWASGSSSVLTKVDGSNGDTVWQRVLEGTFEQNPTTPFNTEWGLVRFRSIDFDSSGNAIIAGWYMPDDNAPMRSCSICAFIVSYDVDGNLLSTTELDAFAGACQESEEGLLYRVTVAPDQSLWAVGIGGLDIVNSSFSQVTRFNSDGSQVLWSHCDPTGNKNSLYFTPVHIAANGDGLVYGHVEAEPDSVTMNRESSELVITRLGDAGNVVFRQVIAGTKVDGNPANFEAGSILEDPQGVLYLSGGTDGELVSGAAAGIDDVFLLRLDANGNRQ